ncbi:hypothetical protein BKH30_06780 [Actinomyces oris]|uniref:ARB-07466-like C-terminal domain-containing protein n=1 Tax=Actinomyces oris TaxID=544580 RepID=A0A1Q8VW04_9ACTO|nr:hypothetical protein BKH30_06780 [Actinomyces oris]
MQASAAGAAGRDGICDSGEVCFYYNSNQQGSVSDFTDSVGSYGNSQPSCYDFKGSGNGKGKCLKNEAASVTNRTGKPVTVYYNSNYQGAIQTIPAGASVNLNSTLKNQNASHRIGDGGSSDNTQPPPATGSTKNPYRGAKGANGGYTPRAQWLKDKIHQQFPQIQCNTYKTGDRKSDHYTGNALDCWGPDSERRKVAEWAKANAGSLEVLYIIHHQRIYNIARSGEGWRSMKNRGSASANHTDHVHISLQHPGNEY